MSEPSKTDELMSKAHRVVQMKRNPYRESSWSCPRCQDTGYVREIVVMPFGNSERTYESVARCRCKAGANKSSSIAVCSDAFWWGMTAAEAADRVSRETAAPFYEPPADPEPPQPPKPVPKNYTEPEPWNGTIVEELDP